jgi:hypothetical protein
MSATTRKTYVCPRPECQRTSATRAYCRHGQPPDIAVGNWMRDADDPTLCSVPPAVIAESEAAEARVALLEYAASHSREWIRAFELRTLGGQGKSMRSIDRAYKQLVESGELEEGDSDFVRLRPDDRPRWAMDPRGSGGQK